MNELNKVVFAADCGVDPITEELNEICPECGGYYADCQCPGPTQQDEYDYKEINGVLYAKRKEHNGRK